MAWSRLQTVGQYSNAALTLQVGIAANGSQWANSLSAGTKLIAWATASSPIAPTITSIQDAAGNSFVLLGSATLPAPTNMILACYVLDTPAGDVGTQPAITITATNTTYGGMALLVSEVSGLTAGTAAAIADGTIAFQGNVGQANNPFPVYTSHATNEFLQQIFADNGGGSGTPSATGYTVDAGTVNNGYAELYMGFKNSTNGSEGGTWTNAAPGSNHYIGAALAFKAPIIVPATGTAAVTFAGTGVATVVIAGTGTGAVTFAGAGTATASVAAGGTGAIFFAGTGTAQSSQVGAAGTGAVTFAGTGTALVTAVIGSGTAAIVFDGTGVVTSGVMTAAGTGAVAFAGVGLVNYAAPNVFPVVWRGPAQLTVARRTYIEGKI